MKQSKNNAYSKTVHKKRSRLKLTSETASFYSILTRIQNEFVLKIILSLGQVGIVTLLRYRNFLGFNNLSVFISRFTDDKLYLCGKITR